MTCRSIRTRSDVALRGPSPSARADAGIWAKRLFLACLAVLSGCRSVMLPQPPVDDAAALRRERNAAAIAEFEQKRSFAELEAARAAWKRGDLKNSQGALERLLRRDPKHRDAQLLLARVHFEQHHHQEAVAQLQTALANCPNDPEVHHAMGTLLGQLGRPEDARAHFDRASKLAAAQKQSIGIAPDLDPKDVAGVAPGASGVLPASVLAGSAAGAGTTDDNSMDGCASPDELLRQGEIALAEGATGRALGLFRRAAALQPDNPQIPTTAAISALRQSCPEVAVIVANEALAVFPRSTPLLRTLGTAYYRQGDYRSSQLVLQQALSLDKADSLAYFLLGCTYLKLEEFEAARECFAEAHRIDPRLAIPLAGNVRGSLR